MSVNNYMKLSGNNVIVDFNSYRGNGFVDAIKLIDIAKVKIMSRQEKKAKKSNSSDIIIKYLTGGTKIISRKELVKQYKFISGKPVVIPFMSNNKEYVVYRNCNETYAALLLPSNMSGMLRGKKINPGNYLVAPKNEDGTINFDELSCISKKSFRKSFVVPAQDVILKNINNSGTESNRIKHRQKSTNNNIRNNETSKFGLDVNNINIPSVNDKDNNLNLDKESSIIQKYPFKAIGRIVNEENNVIGYILEDTKGNKRDLSVNKVMDLCSKHKVANLMLSKTDNGKYFLRGNGIRIESLPQFLP